MRLFFFLAFICLPNIVFISCAPECTNPLSFTESCDEEGITTTETRPETKTVSVNVSETNSSTSVTESGATDNLSITLSSQPLADVILNIVSVDTGEVSVSPSSLTFSSDNWSTAQEITLTAVEDNIFDGIRWSSVTVSVSSTVDAYYAALGSQSIIATVNDSRTGRQQDSLISAGLKYYIAVDNTTGTVYAWGDDNCTDDGYGNCDYKISDSSSVTIGSGPIYPRISDTAPDNTTHLGDNSTSTPIAMPSVVPASPFQIQSNRNTNCVMNSTRDNVNCWGRYNYNNYGIDSSSSIWRLSHSTGAFYDLAIHREGGCALNLDRTVSCWGYGRYGAWGDGNIGYGANIKTPSITNVVDLAAGQDHLCALVDNGTAWCWGRDQSSQLGDNAPNSGGVNGGGDDGSSSPVSVAGGITNFTQIESYAQSTCALTDNGTVWCWGKNANGQLGDGTTTDRDYPVQVQNITDALDIYVGFGSACAAVNKRLDLKCWGSYHLGNDSSSDSSTPVTVTETNGWGSTYTFDDVAIGQGSACAYNLANNDIFCWGRNSEGQLGIGTTETSEKMKRVSTPF
jgi:alpha-tubulin suppressor-like RCC1 family protein